MSKYQRSGKRSLQSVESVPCVLKNVTNSNKKNNSSNKNNKSNKNSKKRTSNNNIAQTNSAMKCRKRKAVDVEQLEKLYKEKNAIFAAADEFRLLVDQSTSTAPKSPTTTTTTHTTRPLQYRLSEIDTSTSFFLHSPTKLQKPETPSHQHPNEGESPLPRLPRLSLPDCESFFETDLSCLPSSNVENRLFSIREESEEAHVESPPPRHPPLRHQAELEAACTRFVKEAKEGGAAVWPVESAGCVASPLPSPSHIHNRTELDFVKAGHASVWSIECGHVPPPSPPPLQNHTELLAAYAQYVKEETKAGNASVWSIEQFKVLVWQIN